MLTRPSSPARVEPSIQTLLRSYNALVADLATMPAPKIGTPWEADRKGEQGRIVRQLGRLGLSSN